MLNNRKTYIAAGLGFISAIALYGQSLLANGFEFHIFLQFVQGAAVMSGLAALRHAISKGK